MERHTRRTDCSPVAPLETQRPLTENTVPQKKPFVAPVLRSETTLTEQQISDVTPS